MQIRAFFSSRLTQKVKLASLILTFSEGFFDYPTFVPPRSSRIHSIFTQISPKYYFQVSPCPVCHPSLMYQSIGKRFVTRRCDNNDNISTPKTWKKTGRDKWNEANMQIPQCLCSIMYFIIIYYFPAGINAIETTPDFITEMICT